VKINNNSQDQITVLESSVVVGLVGLVVPGQVGQFRPPGA